MTECIQTLQQAGLRRSMWRKCLLAAGLLLVVPLFFSCKQTVQSGGAMHFDIVYNLDGGTNHSENPAAYTTDKLPVTLKAPTKAMKGTIKYTFDGWYTDQAGTKKIEKIAAGTTGELTLYAKWKASDVRDISYKVEHWLQQVDPATGKVYDGTKHEAPNYKCADTDELKGKAGTETKAKIHTAADGEKYSKYAGFNEPSVTQASIAADGKTVVKIYYFRNEVTLTFDPNGGTIDGSANKKVLSGKFGETKVDGKNIKDCIAQPVNGSKVFDGWKSEKGLTKDVPATFPEKDTAYTAQWGAPQSASYTVIHWKQPIVGTTYTEKEEETSNGIIGDDTKAKAKTYTGFHLSADKHPGGKITQKKITKDGNTIVEIFYDRDVFTATCKLGHGKDDVLLEGRFEADVVKYKPNPITTPLYDTNGNYIGDKVVKIFEKWNPPLPSTFTGNTTHTAVWKDPDPQTANYTVEYWRQKIGGNGKVCPEDQNDTNYENQDTVSGKRGIVGAQTQAVAEKDYDGFVKPTTIHQETIAPDGKTVVKMYYLRKQVTLTFNPNGGKFNGNTGNKMVRGKFGETIQAAEVGIPEKDDADFEEWEPLFPFPAACPDTDTTYTAKWKTVKELKIKSEPNQKEYNKGEQFDKTGLKVDVYYNNASHRELKDSEYIINGFDSSAVGTKTVTVTYKGKSTTFTVTVKDSTPPS